ncbi:MAG TPA: hypothetical protein VHP82_02770, partial [Gaiellaceae bacterium]|nr:hypothetical protein [Gaiellaceae bacterium]
PREYPFTKVVPFTQMIGGALQLEGQAGARETDFEVLGRMFDGVDLVVDASAEVAVQQLVAQLADERGVPQLSVSATEGAQGGIVARVLPGATGCWLCLQQALYDADIPVPPHDEMGTVQPRGCGSRTFTGTAFDLLPIAAQAVRVAVRTLLDGKSGADVFVCSLAGDSGAPHWTAHELERRASCPGCGTAMAA